MQQTERLIRLWMDYLVVHPVRVIIGSLLISALFLAGLLNFDLNPSPRDYLGKDMPLIAHLIRLEEEYVDDLNIFIMLKPFSSSVFDSDVLSAVQAITERAWTLPYIRRVDSLSNFQYTQVDGDDLLVEDLVSAPADLSADDLERIRNIALNEPALVEYLVARDGRATGISMLFNVDLGKPKEVKQITQALELIKQEVLHAHPDIGVYESGFVSMTDHWRRGAILDITRLFSISLLVIFLGLLYFFRNLRATLAVLGTGGLAVVIGLGLLGLVGAQLNPASVLATLMVLVLGLADGIHVTKSARRLLAGKTTYRSAMVESVVTNFTPIALTSITTAIGFLTFNFTGYAGIRVMGNFVAFGVMMAFILSITMLPALLCFCAIKPESPNPEKKSRTTLADLVVRYHKALLILTVPAVVISIFCISLNEVDERITRYLKKDYVFTRHTDAIQEALTGTTSMIYNFNSGKAGGVNEPEFMAKVEAFSRWAEQQPGVRHVSTYTDRMKRLNQDLHAGDEAYYRLPGKQELAAQYLLLYEMSLPYGLDLTNQINLDKSGTRVVVTTDDLSLQQATLLIEKSSSWLKENAPDFDRFANSNSLSGLLMAQESIRITILSGVVALLIIGLILLFTFRSFYAGLLCVIAVISPILVTYGIWGIVVGVINLPAGLAVCMVIGIAVDFSVHFVSKFVYATRQLNYPAEASVRYAFKLVAAPILTSTVVLSGGFAILVFSVFEYNSVMGSLTALCILMSAASALLLVPSILLTKVFSEKIT